MRDSDHSYCLHLERLAQNKIKELEAELEKERSRPEYSYEAQDQLAALREASETYIKTCRHHKTCWAEIAAVYNGPKPQCSCGYDKLAALLLFRTGERE